MTDTGSALNKRVRAGIQVLAVVSLVLGMVVGTLVALAAPSGGETTTLSNTTPIMLYRPGAPLGCPSFPSPNNSCPPTPPTLYPSPITVSGMSGTVTDVDVSLNALDYKWWDGSDLDVMLVAPGGSRVMLMSDVCGDSVNADEIPISTPIDLTFDDEALVGMPLDTVCLAGTYLPTDEEGENFPFTGEDVFCGPPDPAAPELCQPPTAAEASPTSTNLDTFTGIDPNGVWKLYVVDDTPSDPGSDLDGFNGGWSVTITTLPPPNQAPDAVDDALQAIEDTIFNLGAPGVLGNDADPEGDALSAAVAAGPTSGSLTLNADGSLSYAPNPNFNGTDSFTYTASDGNGGSDTATVTIAVGAVNDAPDAVDDTSTTNEGTTLNVAAPGVLGNDSDPEGNALSAAVATGPANGSLTLDAVGSFTYTPNAGFSGTDSFTYTASDGNGGSDTATVTITVVDVIAADLSVVITDSPDPVPPTGTVTYTVTVTNAGPDAANGVTLSPTLTGGTLGTVTPSQGTCTISKGKTKVVTCNLGTIAAGGSATVTIKATAPRKVGTMSLKASVSSATPDPNSTNNSDTESTTISR